MIISSTPLRISFVGGGSDIPSFYREEMGAVVSTAINKYIYVTVNNRFEKGFRLGYSKTEIVDEVDAIQHKVLRAALKRLKIPGGIEITSVADIPSHGTGLGSSSSFTVGLLNALHTYKRDFRSAEDLCKEACEVEMVDCEDPIGKQDQYIAAYGGFKFIQFNPDESVFVDPIICRLETLEQLQSNLLLLHTGFGHSAADILKAQSEVLLKNPEKKLLLKKMVQLAFLMKEELQKNNLDSFGEILHENWMLKREITDGISNTQIDSWYEKALKAGAIGGKLLGAGGGGFLIFYAPKEKHESIKKSLPELRPVDIRFEKQGSKIIFIH
ncbi:MAG: GHMP kinase [Deltaproteobacteria bacterium RIFCSPLOWO2_01_44_7]|nr:MAG: GHMP kinase [Deltaproteobacteria bacterium RIFCSPHIGHO2_01_FULL_43_49]OGQ16158.1 MAG: GHMP kinase [Deltaproteobacteria bacterium RIFCSPHIGHO2_02_FULL_44_53]OGQ29119.1 MAG: GHMP kinase [Deltaproteobacteria bacterium RIFCSPHIGHO2_12_FULL_44_21]OGQ32675.1 MAG: GHMP kinase [Deltaproteobacteria bacterium RIFCSPLOWO2_01_FULL_45_74]OGQ37540.1 MAG: GHMP kinase [Deltaproteobacteria bacterium RIFCSPLOWO2_01_44_7]OGQ41777.1 MAG: GHMP kinase [Deltaproteobacteria bacterium RIFCSPLOWO2_02_FULL_44_34